MTLHKVPCLVVGGGIGGLTAALALARRGRAVHVLEKADAFTEIGASHYRGQTRVSVRDGENGCGTTGIAGGNRVSAGAGRGRCGSVQRASAEHGRRISR